MNLNDNYYYNFKRHTVCNTNPFEESVTEASISGTTSDKRQGSWNFWSHLGQPDPGEYVVWQGICWEHTSFSSDSANSGLILYDQVSPSGTLTSTGTSCPGCIAAIPATVTYHAWTVCGQATVHHGIDSSVGGSVTTPSNDAVYVGMGTPNFGEVTTYNGICFTYQGKYPLGDPALSAAPLYWTPATQPYDIVPGNFASCGACTAPPAVFHKWKKCSGTTEVNIIAPAMPDDTASSITFYGSVNSPNLYDVVNMDISGVNADMCYTYMGTAAVALAGTDVVTIGTTTTYPVGTGNACTDCLTPPVSGCTDPAANNYNPLATVSDNSCTYSFGCTDPLASNYNALATIDDGSCTFCIDGCMDPLASNYDATATCDDGSCIISTGKAGGCDIVLGTETCEPDGTATINIDLTTGGALSNIITTVDGTPYGISTGCATPPLTIPVTGLTEGQTVKVVAECAYSKEDFDRASGQNEPTWAIPTCGEGVNTQTVSSTTKIIAFYDTTSLGASAQQSMYSATNTWLKDIQTNDAYTGEVYHIKMGGERWVLWSAWLLDMGIDIDGMNSTTIAGNCVSPDTPCSNWDAEEGVLPAWSSDSTSYVQTTGSQGSTKAMPLQITPGEEVLVIVFADEAAGQPSQYTATTTGVASGTTGDSAGTYHYRSSGDTDNSVMTWAEAYYDITLPACMDANAHANGWNMWENDYHTATAKIAAHNAGTGNIKTFVYPSQPPGSAGTARRSFALHVWGTINSGHNNTGLLQSGSTAPTCDIADLSAVVSTGSNANPYVTDGVGRLDQYGFGTNVQCKAFTSQDFATDLNAFLSLGGTTTTPTCTDQQCLIIKAVDNNGDVVMNHPITVNGISVGTTNANGTVSHTLTGSGPVIVNGCFTFTALGSCVQSLITIEISEAQITTALNCVLGCTDPTSWNYNPLAGIDDGSCLHPLEEDPRDSMSRCELLKIDTECNFATDAYNLYKYHRYGLDRGCLYNMDGRASKKYSSDWVDRLLPDYGNETFSKVLHTKDASPKPDWVVTACGEQEDPLTVYFYYDCTSLSQSAVTLARTANEQWLGEVRASRALSAANQGEGGCTSKNNQSIPGHCPPKASNSSAEDNSITAYHTLVFGERWIDWGTSAMTGEFNNNGEFDNKYCGGACSPSGQHLTGNGAIDATVPLCSPTSHFWSTLIYDSPSRLWYNAGGSSVVTAGDNCVGNSTGTTNFVASNPYVGTLNGEAPMAQTDNVLVVAFADETAVGNSAPKPSNAYTYSAAAEYGDGTPKGVPTWTNAMDGNSATCTDCYKNDYDKFVSTYLTWKNASADRYINFFLYPSKPASITLSGAHNVFPLHTLGAISSGNQTVKNGTWTTAPTCSISDLSAAVSSNPYYAETNSVTTHSGIDPLTGVTRVNSGYGGLDQYGWGINVGMTPFTKENFGTDLDEFWDSSVCNDSECLLIKIVDKTGKPIPNYPIVIDGLDVGKTNEFGILRTCIDNASVKTDHKINLCHCFYTTGGCNQQKLTITVDGVNCDDCGNIKMF